MKRLIKQFTFTLLTFIFIMFFQSRFHAIYGQGKDIPEPEMVFVEGGKFMMGSEDGFDDERPVHEVTVESFFIGKYEVTVEQYRTFVNSSENKSKGRNAIRMPREPFWGWHDDHPISNVTWTDAQAYCEWLSKKTGKKYRLPKETEWEYAARGGNKSKGYIHAGSNKPEEVAWYDEKIIDEQNEIYTGDEGTQPVGQLKPNELGIYDMSGNVWEWCQDKYKYYEGNTNKAPVRGVSGNELRVLRGGSWYYDVKYARVTARDGPEITYTNKNYGFRVARSVK